MLDIEPWKEATDLLDERVWVECERGVARERLVRRHLKEGVEYEQEKAEARGEFKGAIRSPGADADLNHSWPQWTNQTCSTASTSRSIYQIPLSPSPL